MKSMKFNVVVKLDFVDLTMPQIAKLEKYLSEGMENQKGFHKIVFTMSQGSTLAEPEEVGRGRDS